MQDNNATYLAKFVQEMTIRKYSKMTIRNYKSVIERFLSTGKFDIRYVTMGYIKDYIYKLAEDRLSSNTISLMINSFKAFFRMVFNNRRLDELHQPKRSKTLPHVLTREEILSMCATIQNRKHRCMVALMYGSGLRLHEVINLKVKDIDFTNARLVIRTAKGGKHRLTVLSSKLFDPLKVFCAEKGPNDYVFTTVYGRRYARRTVQKIVETALAASGIKKHASCHVLRHSFATHLLEDGVNVIMIQKLLGHSNLKTTMIYTRLAREALRDVKSPL